jgi:hypothetical protein
MGADRLIDDHQADLDSPLDESILHPADKVPLF